MKFCTNCGTELTAEQKFCRNCGTKTTVEQTTEEQTTEEQTLEQETPEEQTPEEQTLEEQTPEEQTPEEQTTEEQTPEEQTPEEQTPEEQTPEEQTPEEQTPEEQTTEEQTPEEQTPEEQTLEQETPEEQTPEEQTPVEEKKAPNQKIIAATMGAVAVLGLAIAFAFGGSDTSADSMRLETYQGDLTLLNGKTEKEVVEGQRLASQDNLETYLESNAYISLDRAKLLKLDQTSQIEIVESENKLDIEVLKGSLYFNVSQPLEENESLTFYCNNIVTGVRGTSGVITYLDSIDKSEIVLLSGSVEIETNEATQQIETISAGQVAYVTTHVDESIEVEIKNHEDVPGFHYSKGFLDEEDVAPFQYYTGEPWKIEYIDFLRTIDKTYKISEEYKERMITLTGFYGTRQEHEAEYCLHDIDLDGIPELFVNIPLIDHTYPDQYSFSLLVMFGEFAGEYSQHLFPFPLGLWNGGSTDHEYVLIIPHDGRGLYLTDSTLKDEYSPSAGFWDLMTGKTEVVVTYSNTSTFIESTTEGYVENISVKNTQDLWVGGTSLYELPWYHKDDWKTLIEW